MTTDTALATTDRRMLTSPWSLSVTASYLIGTLAGLTGVGRSRAAAAFLDAALTAESGTGGCLPGYALSDTPRVRGRLRLPADLLTRLDAEAEGRGWPVEVLVEYLSATYMPRLLADAAARESARGLLVMSDAYPVGGQLALALPA